MSFINYILPDGIINALGWTILHSVWQGIVIVCLLFLLLFFFRYHQSKLRYNLSVFSLVLILALCILTFVSNYRDIGQAGFITAPSAINSLNGNDISAQQIDFSNYKFLSGEVINSIAGSIPGKFPYMITIWLLGVMIITIRLTGGFFRTQRLRNSCLYEIPADFQLKFRRLIDRMQVRKLVCICESTLISVPMVIGYFKPLILLPFSAVTHIPCEQLEAIIAHELAHIRRNDYLVNIFQSVMEALLFYNPAVWIIGYQIRKEREHCCDDMAVSFSCDRITYAKALASIHEIPVKHSFPLLALGLKRYPLLSRVFRILKQSKMKTNLRGKILAGLLLIAAIFIILLNTGGTNISFSSNHEDMIRMDNPGMAIEQIVSQRQIDSLPEIRVNVNPRVEPKPKIYINPVIKSEFFQDTTLKVKDNIVQRTFMKDGKEMNIRMKIEHGAVTELYVNEERIPEAEFGQYQAEIDKTLKDVARVEKELIEAREKLEELDMEKLRTEIEESMRSAEKTMKEIDFDAIIDDIGEIEIPEIDEEKIRIDIENAIAAIEDIDIEKIHEEIEKAMESACEAMKNIELPDMDELKAEMEMAKKELAEIDHEKIREEIEKSISEIKINQEEIRRNMEELMKELPEINMEEMKMDLEQGKMKTDEMLKEIKKLELEKK